MKIYKLTVVAGILAILALEGVGRPQEKSPSAGKEALSAMTVLATIAAGERPPQPIPGHSAPALQNEPVSFYVMFSRSVRGVAYIVQKGRRKYYVVHNGNKGRAYSAVGDIALSPDGSRIAYMVFSDSAWRMVVDGKEGKPYNALLAPLFSPDGRHVAYLAKKGDRWYVVVDDTPNEGTPASYHLPEFNADSTLIAYVEAADSNSRMRLIISDLAFRKQHSTWSIGDLLFVANREKTRIAAAQVVNNKVRIIDFSFARPDVVHEGPIFDDIDKLTFGDDGESVSYCAVKDGTRLLVLDGRTEVLPKGYLPQLPVVRPDRKGAGVLLNSDDRSVLHQSFVNGAANEKMYDEAADLAYNQDGLFHAYAARRGNSWFVVVNGKEGPEFDRVVTPMFSPGGKLIYRARKDGKRFLVVADTTGKTLRQGPVYEMVFQPVLTADGKSVIYGAKDGRKLIRKVERIDQ